MTHCSLNEKLESYEDALSSLLSLSSDFPKTINISINDCMGRIVSEDIFSSINVPSFDNSAMDGYAICAPSGLINTPGIKEFKLMSRVAAGEMAGSINENEACRIFTGAPIPNGTTAVIRQEDCDEIKSGFVEVYSPIRVSDNIRPMGQDIKAGQTVLKKGTKITSLNIGVLASIGLLSVPVFSKIKVGVICTGAELTSQGDELRPGMIYNSNIHSIKSILSDLNCDIVSVETIPDSLSETRNSIDNLSSKCQVIITSGGISVGEEDYVKEAVEELGHINLWKVKTKPGKPFAFGNINKCVFIGLPGNPVSTVISLMLYGVPFLKKMQGRATFMNNPVKLPLADKRRNPSFRKEFTRANLDINNRLVLIQNQSSNILTSIMNSSGIVELDEEFVYNKHDLVNFYEFTKILHE